MVYFDSNQKYNAFWNFLAPIPRRNNVCFDYMFNKIMISFHKNVDCPTSQDLLDFQNNEMSVRKNEKIRKHICSCDFCGAEVEFYAHCPQVGDERVAITEIPGPLYELAEALLNNKHKDNFLLNKLLNENNGMTLRKV